MAPAPANADTHAAPGPGATSGGDGAAAAPATPVPAPAPPPRERRLLWAAVLTTSTLVAEAVGGVVSGSLALLADAGHMLVDASALVLAWLGARLARRPPDARRSFGYGRLEVLAGFVNALTLLVLVAWIAWEAVERLREPQPILSGVMLAVALLGLTVNLVVLRVLGSHHHHHHDQGSHTGAAHGHDHGSRHRHEHDRSRAEAEAKANATGRAEADPPRRRDLNLDGARLHVIGDLLGSVAAVAAALTVQLTGWTRIDPLLSLLVAALILVGAWRLLRRAGHILLEGVPDGLDPAELTAALAGAHPDILDAHHVHVWQLGSGDVLATVHLRLHDDRAWNDAAQAARDLLRQRFGIRHATIQLDGHHCPDRDCGNQAG
jgi:cobalt-zinc-cadmium efflux system protein